MLFLLFTGDATSFFSFVDGASFSSPPPLFSEGGAASSCFSLLGLQFGRFFLYHEGGVQNAMFPFCLGEVVIWQVFSLSHGGRKKQIFLLYKEGKPFGSFVFFFFREKGATFVYLFYDPL